MPRIKQIVQEESARQDIPSRRLQATGKDLGTGGAVTVLGKEITQLGSKIVKGALIVADQKARAEVTKIQTDAILAVGKLEEEYLELAQQTPLDDPNFKQDRLDAIDNTFAELGSNITTQKGRTAFEKASAVAKTRLRQSVLTDAAVRAGVHAKNQVSDSMSTLAGMILTDPGQYQPAIDTMFNVVKDPNGLFGKVPVAEQDKFIKETTQTFTRNYVDGISRNDAKAGKELLESGALDDDLSVSDRRSLGNLVNERVEGEEREARRIKTAEKEARKEQNKAISLELYNKLQAGELKQSDINNSGLPVFGPDSMTAMGRLLEARTKDLADESKPVDDHTTISDSLTRIMLPPGTEGRLENVSELYDAYVKGKMKWPTVQNLAKVLEERETDPGVSKNTQVESYFKSHEKSITEANFDLKSGRDPRGMEQFNRMRMDVLTRMAAEKQKGGNELDLITPGNPKYLGQEYINDYRFTRDQSREFVTKLRNIEVQKREQQIIDDAANAGEVVAPAQVDPLQRLPGEDYDAWDKRTRNLR